jgi:ubiquitin-activating enzyme E1
MSKDDNVSLFDEGKATKFMDLYSRQIGTFGVETMKNLARLSVLIVGMKGVGIETAKNVILAGPKAVTIYDDGPTDWFDLGTNFFLKSGDIGKPRSKCVVDQLALLNPFVEVNVMEGHLTPERLIDFGSVVVTCNLPLETLIELDNFCRSAPKPIQFLLAMNNGVVGSVFTDYGPSHVVTDLDGEIARVNVIEEIEIKEDEKGPHLIVTVSSQKHGLDDDQEVEIEDVKGMEELNQIRTFKVKRVYQKKVEQGKPPRDILVPNKLRFDHPDAKSFSLYESGGNIAEVKVKKTFEFKSLKDSVVNPKTVSDMFALLHPNEEKMFMSGADQIHVARLAMWAFQGKHGHFPRLHNKEDANECVALAKEIVEKHKTIEGAIVVDVNEDIVRNTVLYSPVELCGITAFLGGVIAQEVIKKFGKYTPVHQWIHMDYFEILQPDVPQDAQPLGSRYDNQIAVFGAQFQEKVGSQRWFMVGCGALGCEYLKGFALMGLGTRGGRVFVTDMDRIEVSNLNRQFLFRKENVGQPKSVTAAAAAKVMNPEMNIECFETHVGDDTENFFHDGFWEQLDCVCNALDNIKAREYVDSRCVFFRKPLLESGTLGTKANSEIILPFKTKSYREHEKNHGDEESIPMCTLRNFPHLIEHCIEWARAQFTEVFEDPPKDVNKFLNDKESFFKQVAKQKLTTRLEILESVKKLLGFAQRATFTTAILMAFDHFNSQYRDRILNLIFAFPQDFVKKDDVTGEESPFWSGAKRFPRAAEFHMDDELFLDYLYTAANLFAFMLKVPCVRDRDEFKRHVAESNLITPEWSPSSKYLKQVKSEVEKANKPNEQQTQEVEFDDDEVKIKN